MRKLIAVDVDGTLIKDNQIIGERTKKALIEAQKRGHKVVISSGRSPKGVMEYALELEMDKYESYISNYNGAIVTDVKTLEVPINHKMDFELLKEILQYSDNLDINYMIYHNNTIYTNNPNTYKLDEVIEKNGDMDVKIIPDLSYSIDFTPNNILFSQKPERIKEPADKLMEKFGDITTMMYSYPYFFEVVPKNVSKGIALLEIAEYLGIEKENVYAFGDHDNDKSMIEMAGTGIAMGNAIPELKEVADFITLTNNEDGIAVYLEENILND